MITEDEAQQECCIGPSDCGHRSKSSGRRQCIASDCGMAWRFGGERETRDVNGETVTVAIGYCGLAGKP